MVVCGGLSGEREVSLSSGRECTQALVSAGYEVREVDFSSLEEFISQVKIFRPEVIFNALHGSWGESGQFQGILDTIKIPYTHSGLLPSALAMNKYVTKKVLDQRGIPTPNGFLITKDDIKDFDMDKKIKFPCVIKPNDQGSSLGVIIAKNAEEFFRFINSAQRECNLPSKISNYLIEEYIPGRELTTAIVNNKPLAVTEIITDDWYDYKAKYNKGGSCHVVPADIPSKIYKLCQEYALLTHTLLGCRGVTRIDFRWNDRLFKEGLFVLEINTQPGMTPTSLVPEQAAVSGISFKELCSWIVEDASCYR